jgi:hypothetical protein
VARLTLLIAGAEIIGAALFGVWTQTDGEEVRAPCPQPEAYSAEPLRLPRGCQAHRAGVWREPAAWLEEEARRARLEARVEAYEKRAQAAEERAREADRALIEAHTGHAQQLEALAKLCAPAPPPACPVWTPRAEGATAAALTCAAYLIGSK